MFLLQFLIYHYRLLYETLYNQLSNFYTNCLIALYFLFYLIVLKKIKRLKVSHKKVQCKAEHFSIVLLILWQPAAPSERCHSMGSHGFPLHVCINCLSISTSSNRICLLKFLSDIIRSAPNERGLYYFSIINFSKIKIMLWTLHHCNSLLGLIQIMLMFIRNRVNLSWASG